MLVKNFQFLEYKGKKHKGERPKGIVLVWGNQQLPGINSFGRRFAMNTQQGRVMVISSSSYAGTVSGHG